MKITQSVVAILLTTLLFRGSQQACLTTAQLNALGFTVAANFTAAGNSSNVCTDLYSNGGNCVDAAQVQTLFNTNQANLQANAQASVNANNALNSILTAINSITNLVGNLTANITSNLNATLTNLTNSLGNLTANASVGANGNVRTLQSTTTSVSANTNVGNTLQNIINNSNNAINPCYQAYQNLVNGIYCYLTSNQATNNTAVTTTGTTTNFVVNVNTDTTGNALNACIPVLDSYCLVTYGVSITSNTNAFAGIFQTSANSTGKVSLATCQTLQSNYNCTTTACQVAVKNALINNVFSATSVNFVQSKDFTDSRANAGASISSFFGSRRLQASPNNSSSVQTQSSSTGQDINKNGQNSGASTTTYKASAKLIGAFFALLVTFLYA